jgi:hypothetical protein
VVAILRRTIMTGRSKIAIGSTVFVIFLVAGMVLWGCPREVRGASPIQSPQPSGNAFDAAFARFEERFATTAKRVVNPLATVTSDTRNDLLDVIVKSSTFLLVNAQGGLTPTTLNGQQLTLYREVVDSILEVGDVLFKVTWTLGDRTFTNTGVANSKFQPKFEPILSTLAYRSARGSSAAVAAYPLLSPLLIKTGTHAQQTKPSPLTSRDEWSLYNFFNSRVAWAVLEIREIGGRFDPDVSKGWRPLWTVSSEQPRLAPTNRGRCLDVAAKIIWASYIVNIKLVSGSNVEFGAEEGLALHRGEETLRARRCR